MHWSAQMSRFQALDIMQNVARCLPFTKCADTVPKSSVQVHRSVFVWAILMNDGLCYTEKATPARHRPERHMTDCVLGTEQ